MTTDLPVLTFEVITFVKMWHDGPITGLCTFRGRTHYFELDPEADNQDRLYVYPLSDEEETNEQLLQHLFESYIGTHWSFYLPSAEQVVNPEPDFAAYEETQRVCGLPALYERDYASTRSPVAIIEL